MLLKKRDSVNGPLNVIFFKSVSEDVLFQGIVELVESDVFWF